MASLCQHVLLSINRNIKYSFQNVICKNQNAINFIIYRKFTYRPLEYNENRDPAPLFFKNDIQQILKKLTRPNMEKIFRHRRLETKKLEQPEYKFMTEEELQASLEEAKIRADEMLQMPPVIKVREPINKILSKDPALQGYDTVKYVFTDITYGVSDRNRLVVIRDTEGNLAAADWDIRQRMNQIYFPRKGRELVTPKMFNEDNLKSLLERKEYEFILDRACVQFEPDDPEYQRITSIVYQYVNDNIDFEILRSTRHFGPMTFFLTWFKSLDNLILELIETDHINDINTLISLHNKLYENEAVGTNRTLKSEDDTSLVEEYIAKKSNKKGQLELALQSYKELLKQKTELELGIKKAHGVA